MKTVLSVKKLGFQWDPPNPFLFCVHHNDNYPAGTPGLGVPEEKIVNRQIGMDFDLTKSFRMYHGDTVPGFPMHPHRGFETITIVERGLIDHSDSYGGKGRYGYGDVQWMTAGAGIQHAEMFPLIHQDKENPLELFQIWLNLPKAKKFVKPAYQMIWHEDIKIPREKNGVNVKLITGKYSGIEAPCPVPDSYASDTSNEVLILLIDIPAGATYELSPSVQPNLNRTLYMFKGDHMEANGEMVPFYHSAALQSDASVMLINGNKDSRMLLLQAKPINEPVVQRGPFVMNTIQEIEEAYADYRKSGFGGWPWDREDPVHGVEAHRFAQYADGIKIVKDKYVK